MQEMLLDSWSALCTVYSSCFLFISNPTFSLCFALEMEGFCTETISFLSPYKNIQPDVVRKKMVLPWSRRCCNTCKTAWNVKFLLANCVILLGRRYKNKLLELQEKLSNNWAIGRPTIEFSSWRWDQIRVKVSILNLHIWMLTLEISRCCEASGVENEDQQGLSVGFILLWRSWKNHPRDQFILVYPGLLLWFGKFPC